MYPDLSFYSHQKSLFPILFISFFLIASILLKSPRALSVPNKFRKNWILVLTQFVISTIIFLLVEDGSGTEFLYVFFPVSVILANGIEFFQKKWYADAIIILFLIASFAVSAIM